MPALLTNSGRYIKANPKRAPRRWSARCFTCRAEQASADDYALLWRHFKAKMFVLTVKKHKFWVCRECNREAQKGTLISTRLAAYNGELRRRKISSSNRV